MHYASHNLFLLKPLLKANAPLIKYNLSHHLPLHSVLITGNLSTFKYVLAFYESYFEKKGRDDISSKNLKTKDYKTPIMLSMEIENDDIFWYLMGQEVELNEPDLNGNMLTLLAAQNLRFDIL